MTALVTVYGDTYSGEESTEVDIVDVPDVHVRLAGEYATDGDTYAGAAATCSACGVRLDTDGEAVDGDGVGWLAGDECPENVRDEYGEDPWVRWPHEWSPSGARCVRTGCNVAGTGDAANDGACEAHPDWQSDYGPHDPTPIPVSWCNSANVNVDESRDTVTVTISVGDPRGAFAMRVERMRYTDTDGTERDELRLSVPHPDDSMPHMTLTPLASPGYYRIGG